ncbi:MAG: subtilisin family serine protease, partial [Planctomycetota bacterium]
MRQICFGLTNESIQRGAGGRHAARVGAHHLLNQEGRGGDSFRTEMQKFPENRKRTEVPVDVGYRRIVEAVPGLNVGYSESTTYPDTHPPVRPNPNQRIRAMKPRQNSSHSRISTVLATSTLSLCISPWAFSQQEERIPAGPQNAETTPQTEYPTVAGGEVNYVNFVNVSDDVPMPGSQSVRADALGDELLAQPGGDPFYLGFSGGTHRPAAGERIDPRLMQLASFEALEGRPADTVYAFVMFEKRITDARRVELESLGARVIGFHPHHSLKVALPKASIGAVSELPFVRWVGLAKNEQKVHPILARTMALPDQADGLIEVFVNVFESDLTDGAVARSLEAPQEANAGGDSDLPSASPTLTRSYSRTAGWQEAKLEGMGMEIDYFQESLSAFRGRMTKAQIQELLSEDWVLFVEQYIKPTMAHDESTPMISSDWARSVWDGGTNGEAIVGEVDSGIENSHFDLNHIWGIGWDQSGQGTGPWADGNGHGTHVAGTIMGNGDVEEGHTGNAPGIGGSDTRRVFNVRIFDDAGSFGSNMTDILDVLHQDYVGSTTTPRPHVINHSWRTTGAPYFGTEADARALDNDIYLFDQLHIFAAGNEGSSSGTIGLQPSSKNVLTVGSIRDYYSSSIAEPGLIAGSSSRGPCADGRWKPNLCAPGTSVTSADSGNNSGYTNKSGTSMATPHVVGVAAQMVDRHSFLRYNPPTLRAVMMAGSMPYENQILSTPSNSHLDNYGTGKLNALKASSGNAQQAMYFWGVNITSSNYAYVDMPINPGATQVTFVMTYTEIAGSAGGSVALVNDMDMYVDRAPFTAGGNTGEYFAQNSSIDNTEIRILQNPTAADYRIKIYPEFFAGGFFSTVKVGICAIVTYGDTTPTLTTTGTTSDAYVKPNEQVEIVGTAFSPSYFADGAYIRTVATGETLHAARTILHGGEETNLLGNQNSGTVVTLGDIHHNQTRRAEWDVSWASQGQKTFTLNFSGNNIADTARVVNVTVDGTAPSGPSGLTSTTHTVNVPSCSTGITAVWNPATDALSGLNGYNGAWNANPNHVGSEII